MAWKGESRRHSLARRGIKTVPQNMNGKVMKAYGIQYDKDGEVMLADGWLGDVYDKLKSPFTKKTVEEKLAKQNVIKAKEEKKKAKQDYKDQKEQTKAVKQQAKASRKQEEKDRQEREQKEHFGKKPDKSEVDVDNKGRLGALKGKIGAVENTPTPAEKSNITEQSYESVDPDVYIELAEDSEKLINYKNELKHDIGMLEVEGKRLRKRFEADERKELRDLKADRKKAKADIERKTDQLKMSGMDTSKMKHKISKLENEYKQEYENREIELGALRNRNRITIDFVKDLVHDNTRNIRKMDKKIKMLTASGVKKGGD